MRKDDVYNHIRRVGSKSVGRAAIHFAVSARLVRDFAASDPRIKIINFHNQSGRVIYVKKVTDLILTIRDEQ